MILMGPPGWSMGAPTPFGGPCGPNACISIDQGILWLVIVAVILMGYNYLKQEE